MAKPSSLEHKNEKLILECYNCKQRYRKKFNKQLIKRFASTYKFCNNDLNKLVLLLRKGVYPYEYMDTWERFSEISLPNKEDFYSNLNMENINDIDYRHANNVFKSSVKWTVLGHPRPELNKVIFSTKPSGPFWATGN